MYQPFYSKVLIANLNELQFLSKSIENRDLCSEIQLAGKQFNFRHCNTTISYYKKYFLKKELNSASGKKDN